MAESEPLQTPQGSAPGQASAAPNSMLLRYFDATSILHGEAGSAFEVKMANVLHVYNEVEIVNEH
jgi:hypothetical protein